MGEILLEINQGEENLGVKGGTFMCAYHHNVKNVSSSHHHISHMRPVLIVIMSQADFVETRASHALLHASKKLCALFFVLSIYINISKASKTLSTRQIPIIATCEIPLHLVELK